MNEDRAREAAEHLRAATLEAIAAGRVLLDLLEEAVQEPGPLLGVIAATMQSAQEAAKGVWDQVASTAGGGAGADTSDGSATNSAARPRVQHIRVS